MRPYILQRYLFIEIFKVTALNTFVLTSILLYGNLIKNDESIIQALSLSFSSFIELVLLLVPYSLSMGLPFGFALAVLFCFSRWSYNQEIQGLRSLGFSLQSWIPPVLILAIVFSGLCSFASLYWAPVNRAKFETRKNDIIWENLNKLIQRDGQIEFKVGSDPESNSLESFQSFSKEKLTSVSISVAEITEEKWKNLRILLFGEKNKVVSVVHAKYAEMEIDRSNSLWLNLELKDIDIEPGYVDAMVANESDSFFYVSFDSWKSPIAINLAHSSDSSNVTKMGIGRIIRILDDPKDHEQFKQAKLSLSKNIALGTSPFFLSLVLIPLSAKKGRKESILNLTIGIFVCLLYYGLGFLTANLFSAEHYDYLGWWFPNFICMGAGLFYIYTYEKCEI